MLPLLIIDGDNLAHRAYHSTPKSVENNAIVGFTRMLANLYEKERPRGVFVAWDTLGIDTYRNELWPPYQTGRVFEPEIVRQLNLLPDICGAFGFGVGKEAGFEADDLMASAAKAEVEQSGTCLLLTTDRDSFQLVSDQVTVLSPRRGARELDRIGPREVVAHFGVLPQQVPDFKALCGDPSDKIPGIKGIGPKSAADLLLKYGNLESVLAAWNDPVKTELALRFREVVTMRPTAQVQLPKGDPDWVSGAAVMRDLGADSLAERLLTLAS
ncbi:MAG: 5'-3' exonuclease [Fimbriimonadaceae bacterium]|nr:5'-3' exonuclease [Fimbriimonadaceae bacterium]